MKTFTIKELNWNQLYKNTFQSKLGLGYVADVTNFDTKHKLWQFSIYFDEDCHYQLCRISDSNEYESSEEAIQACIKKWHEILLSILELTKEN